MKSSRKTFWGVMLALACASVSVHAQLIIDDKLTGTSSSYPWTAINGACLTAGDGSGSIPACAGLNYYNGKTLVGGETGRLPDTPGKGALRLTNGDTRNGGNNGDNQTGAVVYRDTFPTNEGLQVTFTTVTYGGDGDNGTGADGISFFLADGAKPASVGALGGSLGYSCSNSNGTYDGVLGGYLGIGIDEYGNFANPGDNTDTGPGFRAGRISLRGAGNTAYSALSADPTYGPFYPANASADDKRDAVHNTCKTKTVWNYSGGRRSRTDNKANTGIALPASLSLNYPLLATQVLPAGVTISNQQGMNTPLRANATPITYDVKITQDGLLDFSYSVNGGDATSVISNRRITLDNGPLPASFRFGFSAGTGGSNNVHEITCFKAAPLNQSASSAGTNVQQSARVEAGTQVYLAYYHPTNWWGQLTAQNLLVDDNGVVSINAIANWDASCTLTGGNCQATRSNVTAQTPDSRVMLTWDPTATTPSGVPFRWDNLSAAQKANLTAGDGTATDARLRYLRGDRSAELNRTGGSFRTRTGLLGDIINSSPTWVGAPSLPYQGPWSDALFPAANAPESATTAQQYEAFKTNNAARQNVVYVGANDGFLHGFRSGAYTAGGTFDPMAANDGREVLAYMPANVLKTIHSTSSSLDFGSSQYSHNLYVDATPGTGDLFYGGQWHTWLVGGTGAGGAVDAAGNATGPIADKTTSATNGVIYALDITDPSQFSETGAAAIVKGEWSSSTITCNVADCGRNLGSTYGTPIIRRPAQRPVGRAIRQRAQQHQWRGRHVHHADRSGQRGHELPLPAGRRGACRGREQERHRQRELGRPRRRPRHRLRLCRRRARQPLALRPHERQPGPVGRRRCADVHHLRRPAHHDATHGFLGRWRRPARPARRDREFRHRPAAARDAGQRAQVRDGHAGAVRHLGLEPQRLERQGHLVGAVRLAVAVAAADRECREPAGPERHGAGQRRRWRHHPLSLAQFRQGVLAGLHGLRERQQQVRVDPAPADDDRADRLQPDDGLRRLPRQHHHSVRAASLELRSATGIGLHHGRVAGHGRCAADGGGNPQQSFFADQNGNFMLLNGGIISGIGLSATGTPSIVTARQSPYLVQQTVGGTGVVTKINPGAGGAGKRITWIKRR